MYNPVVQSLNLLQNLKLRQYAKIPPRTTFTVQTIGTVMLNLRAKLNNYGLDIGQHGSINTILLHDGTYLRNNFASFLLSTALDGGTLVVEAGELFLSLIGPWYK
ncbi:hypothetical protein CVT25_011405 [Psilocybe cyanescens]|uniref:Uncharacterized protein n=1 Tax=Psilocybe cyanescens TaxID=93625 RepID=A0A409XV88_PSICY|nr:hypothetical protein CVT25_011405 [Psilocybe cyanescens]